MMMKKLEMTPDTMAMVSKVSSPVEPVDSSVSIPVLFLSGYSNKFNRQNVHIQ